MAESRLLAEKIEKPPLCVRLFDKKSYFKDNELLKTLETEKYKITKILKDYFDNSFERFLKENDILEGRIDFGIEIKK